MGWQKFCVYSAMDCHTEATFSVYNELFKLVQGPVTLSV